MKKLILVLVCAVFSVSASAQTQKTYRSNREFSEGLKRVGNADGSGNNIYGFVNEAGEEVIPLQYDDASSFSDGLAHAYIKNKCGLIDKTGKVPFQSPFP